MPEVTIIDPKTGRKLGKLNDETGVTEISEEWQKTKKKKEEDIKTNNE